ncbi:DUF6603 domain-containing protein [Natronorubrum sp. DTA7]|uniref:DUF6603 domain-containing protein n=1 Tax=Natronorubrum sp. DTA7 TaxID=3447016 RepID=UPI003F83CFA2
MTDDDGAMDLEDAVSRELARLFEPIDQAVEDGPVGVFTLLNRAGIETDAAVASFESIEQLLDDVASAYQTVRTTIRDNSVPDPQELRAVFETIRDLNGVNLPDSVDVDGIGTVLLDYLFVEYLETYQSGTYQIMRTTGVIVVEERDDGGSRQRLVPRRIPELLQEPRTAVEAAVEWGSSDFRASMFVSHLYWLFRTFGLFPRLENPYSAEQRALTDDGIEESASAFGGRIGSQLVVPVVYGPSGEYGFRVVTLPETADHYPGIALVPYTPLDTFDLDEALDLGADWTLHTDASFERTDWGIVVQPPKDDDGAPVDLRGLDPDADGLPVSVRSHASLTYDGRTEDEEYRPLLGSADGSGIALGSIGVGALFEYDDELAISAELPAEGRLGISPTDFDGFLSNVLPEDGLFYAFDVLLGVSTAAGLYFESGGTLEAAIPQNAQLGPVSVEEIYVAALPGGVDDEDGDDPSVTLTANASASVELGPVVGTVQRMGIRASIALPEDGDGSLGPIDLDVGFDPPNGIGLAVDAEGVSGGGFLEFDYENERYAGAVQLHVGELTFNAVGLLTTRMPDGSDGFSLLILITAEFPPIELGLGFTLNGVGGLVGIHRGVKTDPLKRAVRDGTLDSVLFPEDVVENAPRIVSDLRETFPPTADYHVFGPMARLGWGTPTLITADLGVLLEIPSIRIVLLGRISAVLPDEVAPLVELNAGVFGIIDPAIPELELHASLYDSRVVAWELSGDFGLRIRGGDQPDFLLSAGGFHPQYDPPASFADMRRLRASLGPPGGNPSLDLKGYFAVTSNTVQAGANCSFAGEFGPASVDGELGFDALVQFDPFEFIVDVIASLSVRALKTTFSVSLEGSLSGPAPWHIDGTVKVSIAFVSATVRVDATFGSADDRDALPPVDVLSKLAAALEQPGNWKTGLPGVGESPVTLRDPGDVDVEGNGEDETPTILVHPLAAPSVRQTVVPLDFEIERFGNAKPADATRFEIAGASVDGEDENEPTLSVGESVTEKFAPGEYLDLSDDERLDSPAFESMQAGTRFESGGVYAGQETADDGPDLANNARRTVLAYETSVRDERCGTYGVALDSFDAVEVVPTSFGSEITRQLTRATIDRRTIGCETGPAPKETVDEGTTPSEATLEGSFTGGNGQTRYRIVRTDTFEPVDLDGHDDGGYTKAEAKRTIERDAPDGATSRYQVVAADQLE